MGVKRKKEPTVRYYGNGLLEASRGKRRNEITPEIMGNSNQKLTDDSAIGRGTIIKT